MAALHRLSVDYLQAMADIRRLAGSGPQHASVQALLSRAVKAGLAGIPQYADVLQPHERRSVSEITQAWALQVRNRINSIDRRHRQKQPRRESAMTATFYSTPFTKRDEPRKLRKLSGLHIEEVSLVDRGSNPHAHIMFFKRDTPPVAPEIPEEYDDPAFDATGRGPMHARLWELYDDYKRSMNYAQPAFQAAWNDLTADEKQTVRDEETAYAAAVQAAADAEQKERQKSNER